MAMQHSDNGKTGAFFKADASGRRVAEISYIWNGGEQIEANHTWVDDSLRGQGAGHNGLTSAIWRAWGTIYGSPAIYRSFSWLASRFRWLTPRKQAGWTSVRTPMQPAPKRLRDLIKERN